MLPRIKHKLTAYGVTEKIRRKYLTDLFPDISTLNIGGHIFDEEKIEKVLYFDITKDDKIIPLLKKVFQEKYPISRINGVPKVPSDKNDKDLLIEILEAYFHKKRGTIMEKRKRNPDNDNVSLRESINHLEKIKLLLDHFDTSIDKFPYEKFQAYIDNKEYINVQDDIDESLSNIHSTKDEDLRIRNLLRQFAKVYMEHKHDSSFVVADPGLMAYPDFDTKLDRTYRNKVPPVILPNLIELLDVQGNLSENTSRMQTQINNLKAAEITLTNAATAHANAIARAEQIKDAAIAAENAAIARETAANDAKNQLQLEKDNAAVVHTAAAAAAVRAAADLATQTAAAAALAAQLLDTKEQELNAANAATANAEARVLAAEANVTRLSDQLARAQAGAQAPQTPVQPPQSPMQQPQSPMQPPQSPMQPPQSPRQTAAQTPPIKFLKIQNRPLILSMMVNDRPANKKLSTDTTFDSGGVHYTIKDMTVDNFNSNKITIILNNNDTYDIIVGQDLKDDTLDFFKDITNVRNPLGIQGGGKLIKYCKQIANEEVCSTPFTLIEEFEAASKLDVKRSASEQHMFESFLEAILKEHFSSNTMKEFYFEAHEVIGRNNYEIANLCFKLLEICDAINKSKLDIDVVRLSSSELNSEFDDFEEKLVAANYDFFSAASKEIDATICITFSKHHIYFYKQTNSFVNTYTIDNSMKITQEYYDFNEDLYYISDSVLYFFFILSNYFYMKPHMSTSPMVDVLDKFSRTLKRKKNTKSKSIKKLLEERWENTK